MFYTYIMASSDGVAIYVGCTDDLVKRIWEHKSDIVEGHTKKYQIHKLVYFEQYDTREDDLQREKRLKRWNRDWKHQLIEKTNPRWNDLYPELCN